MAPEPPELPELLVPPGATTLAPKELCPPLVEERPLVPAAPTVTVIVEPEETEMQFA